MCEQDSLVDVNASEKVAQDAPQGEVAHYPIGHFEIYTGEWFERAVTRQAEFLARHLHRRRPAVRPAVQCAEISTQVSSRRVNHNGGNRMKLTLLALVCALLCARRRAPRS